MCPFVLIGYELQSDKDRTWATLNLVCMGKEYLYSFKSNYMHISMYSYYTLCHFVCDFFITKIYLIVFRNKRSAYAYWKYKYLQVYTADW